MNPSVYTDNGLIKKKFAIPHMKKDPDNERMIAQNRRARFDYAIESTLEAGIELYGTEVKSLRSSKASINESYASEKDGELYIINANIPEYQQAGSFFQHEPRRPRKLLVHKKELNKLLGAIRREGMTIVPISLYFNKNGRAKILLGLAKGRKKSDKREVIKQREWERSKSRIMRKS